MTPNHFPHPWVGIRPFKRHSLVLLVAGVVYILLGGSYIFTDMSPSREHALTVALDWFPMTAWGVIFGFAGLLAIISSRWPPISETWGYTVLTGLSAGWGAFYAMGVIFRDSPTANLSGALIWGFMGFMWWAVSGLINPDVMAVINGDE